MIEQLKEKVKLVVDQFIDKAGLLGLANIVKSISVNLELSEEDRMNIEALYNELMEAERVTEIPDGH